jgi:hypothetical protein
MALEQRAYRDAYDAAEVYAIDIEVFNAADSLYYTSLQDGNVGNDPATATSFWELTTALEKYIALDQTGKTELGAVKDVTARNPRTNPTYPGHLGFTINENGIAPSTLAGSQVWLYFRLTVPEFTSAIYAVGSTYALDELVFLVLTGECYKSLQAGNTGNAPNTAADWWEKVDFPKFLASYTKSAVYEDELAYGEGQQMKAQLEDLKAYTELSRLEDTIMGQQGQAESVEVSVT